MKAYKLEVIVVDLEGLGKGGIIDELENGIDYFIPTVTKVVEADIGEWYDEHPLNMRNTPVSEINEYFKENNDETETDR